MLIKEPFLYEDNEFELEYHDCDSFENLPLALCQQIYGICFLENNIVIGHNGKKDTWGLLGGTVEKDEKIPDTLFREVKEESNMHITKWQPLGYQFVITKDNTKLYQLRAYCEVEKIGEFENDIGGSIDKIKIINPLDYRQYFDWKSIGERIIQRGIQMHCSNGK